MIFNLEKEILSMKLKEMRKMVFLVIFKYSQLELDLKFSSFAE
jgi:hypothetical protein